MATELGYNHPRMGFLYGKESRRWLQVRIRWRGPVSTNTAQFHVSDPATATTAREMEAARRRAALELRGQRSPCFRRGMLPASGWPKECNPRRLVTQQHVRIPVIATVSHSVPDRAGVDGTERQRRQRKPDSSFFHGNICLSGNESSQETIPRLALPARANEDNKEASRRTSKAGPHIVSCPLPHASIDQGDQPHLDITYSESLMRCGGYRPFGERHSRSTPTFHHVPGQ